ncbi:MAG: hypothetical protein DRP45_00130 [Candidatus Zixiibacteriota bacterium]|nr:MAG: hypothetical protein DRP45_00130 [candidate division Zixibacteria bacterium]
MRPLSIREIAQAGLIAAAYAVLCLVFAPISFAVYQVRVAEALTVLPFLTRAAIPGLFIGCLLANWFGGMGWQDIVFGSLITLIAAILTRLVFHLSRSRFGTAMAAIPAIMLWAGGLVLLNKEVLRLPVIGLAAISLVLLLSAARFRNSGQLNWMLIHILRFASLACLVILPMLSGLADMSMEQILGVIALLAAWTVTWIFADIICAGRNPNVLIAPLPPVLLNAFGVSLYLAPIIGVNYWFSVQMVGVGQLIACYLLGLPLLRLLEQRRSLLEH